MEIVGNIPVEEQEIVFQEESPDSSSSTGDLRLTVFENCDSFTGYTVRVLGEDFVPLYEYECRTESLFLIPEALIQSARAGSERFFPRQKNGK